MLIILSSIFAKTITNRTYLANTLKNYMVEIEEGLIFLSFNASIKRYSIILI